MRLALAGNPVLPFERGPAAICARGQADRTVALFSDRPGGTPVPSSGESAPSSALQKPMRALSRILVRQVRQPCPVTYCWGRTCRATSMNCR
jgi:hypothetical protein